MWFFAWKSFRNTSPIFPQNGSECADNSSNHDIPKLSQNSMLIRRQSHTRATEHKELRHAAIDHRRRRSPSIPVAMSNLIHARCAASASSRNFISTRTMLISSPWNPITPWSGTTRLREPELYSASSPRDVKGAAAGGFSSRLMSFRHDSAPLAVCCAHGEEREPLLYTFGESINFEVPLGSLRELIRSVVPYVWLTDSDEIYFFDTTMQFGFVWSDAVLFLLKWCLQRIRKIVYWESGTITGHRFERTLNTVLRCHTMKQILADFLKKSNGNTVFSTYVFLINRIMEYVENKEIKQRRLSFGSIRSSRLWQSSS